jgi:hypothetical protein
MDSDLINLGLLLYIPKVTIIRHPNSGPVVELVDIEQLRRAIAQDLGNIERHIDNFVAMGLLLGTDYLPGVTSLEMLAAAGGSVGNGFLVENVELNREFLEQFFLAQESQHSTAHPGKNNSELAVQYLSTYAWVLKLYMCGVPRKRGAKFKVVDGSVSQVFIGFHFCSTDSTIGNRCTQEFESKSSRCSTNNQGIDNIVSIREILLPRIICAD